MIPTFKSTFRLAITRIFSLLLIAVSLSVSLQGGYQIELPLNKRVLISFPYPYEMASPKVDRVYPATPKSYQKPSPTPILDIIDMNITDNNITALHYNTFSPAKIRKFNEYDFADIKIEVHHFDPEKRYLSFSSANDPSYNTLKNFEVGKAYYIKVSHTGTTNHKVGLILGDGMRYSETLHPASQNGWHMYTLNDDLLTQSTSALFLPLADTTFWLSSAGREFEMSIDFKSAMEDAVRSINFAVSLQKAKGYPINITAYPAKKIESGTETEGVIVINDTFIATNYPAAQSITNRPLVTTTGYSQGNLEHLLAFELTTQTLPYNSVLTLTNRDKKIDIPLQSGATTTDHINAIENQLGGIAKNGNYGVYKIDANFTKGSTAFNQVLLSLDQPFGIKEALHIKSFKKSSDDGNFLVQGKIRKRVNNISKINTISSETGVSLHDKGDSFDLVSTDEKMTMKLDEVDTSVLTPIAPTSKGYITKVYKDINLFNRLRTINNYDSTLDDPEGYVQAHQAYIDNLQRDFIYSTNLNDMAVPRYFSKKGFQISSLYTINFTQKSWLNITINSQWKKNLERLPFPLTSIYKEKGYFMYLFASPSISMSLESAKEECNISPNFSNDDDAKTYNEVICDYSFKINSLKTRGKEYNAVALLGKKVYHLFDNDGFFSFRVDSNDLNLKDDRDYTIDINIVDGLGNEMSVSPFVFPYKKPPKPPVNKNDNGDILFSQETIIYKDFISDVDQTKNLIGNGTNYLQSRQLSWEKLGGQGANLIAINKTKKGLYSDISKFKFFPFSSSKVQKISQDKVSNNQVQLNKFVDDMTIYFEPLAIKGGGFIGSFYMMYLQSDDYKVIASIVYDTRYANKTFYVSYKDETYQGTFQDNNIYNTDVNPYKLKRVSKITK